MSRGKKGLILLLILGVLTGVGYWQRAALLAGWMIDSLSQADDSNRELWVDRVASLEEGAVPRLIKGLEQKEAEPCQNLGLALTELTKRWGASDPRSMQLLAQLRMAYSQLSMPGQNHTLAVTHVVLDQSKGTLPENLLQTGEALIQEGLKDQGTRASALRLAGAWIEKVSTKAHLEGRQWVALGLGDSEPNNRRAAIELLVRPPFQGEMDLFQKVIPLLRDPSVSVRKTALIALGTKDVVNEEDLLHLLHDSDVEIQSMCEVTLRSRGLSEEHLLLARLVSDEKPLARLAVFHHLQKTENLDPIVWLKRLMLDPSPAVRAAAIRSSLPQGHPELHQQVQRLALQDPSPTVRELAAFYSEGLKK